MIAHASVSPRSNILIFYRRIAWRHRSPACQKKIGKAPTRISNYLLNPAIDPLFEEATMSEYQAQEIELTMPAHESRLRAFGSLNTLRAKVLPVILGSFIAIAAHAGLGYLAADTAIRVAAAFAGAASWLYLALVTRQRAAMAILNFAVVAGLFTLAVASLNHSWALPVAYAVHAGWSVIMGRNDTRLDLWLVWTAVYATLSVLLWLG
jgi:hypothetical protein